MVALMRGRDKALAKTWKRQKLDKLPYFVLTAIYVKQKSGNRLENCLLQMWEFDLKLEEKWKNNRNTVKVVGEKW